MRTFRSTFSQVSAAGPTLAKSSLSSEIPAVSVPVVTTDAILSHQSALGRPRILSGYKRRTSKKKE